MSKKCYQIRRNKLTIYKHYEIKTNSKPIFLLTIAHTGFSQHIATVLLPIGKHEYWWGGVVEQGSSMPFLKPAKEFDLVREIKNNQVVPLFISNKGLFIWS